MPSMFYGNQTDYIAKMNLLASDYTLTSKSGVVGGTTTLDCSLGSVFYVTLGDGNTTIAVTNIPNSTFKLTIYVKQSGVGTDTITWPTGTRWPTSGSTLSTGINRVDIVELSTVDSGNRFYGRIIEKNYDIT